MAIPLKQIARARKFEREASQSHRSWYREFVASDESLARFVVCTWEGKAGWTRCLRLLPDACLDIVWNGERLLAVGPSACASFGQVSQGDYRVGLRLRCGSAGTILGVPGHALRGKTLCLRDAWGLFAKHAEQELSASKSRAEQRQLLEELIACRLDDGARPDELTLEAARRITSCADAIERAGAELDLSARELRRRFAAEVGLGPKMFQRIQRFDGFIRRIPDLLSGRTTMATLAMELDYADQAHLSRECRAFSGSPPTVLVECYRQN